MSCLAVTLALPNVHPCPGASPAWPGLSRPVLSSLPFWASARSLGNQGLRFNSDHSHSHLLSRLNLHHLIFLSYTRSSIPSRLEPGTTTPGLGPKKRCHSLLQVSILLLFTSSSPSPNLPNYIHTPPAPLLRRPSLHRISHNCPSPLYSQLPNLEYSSNQDDNDTRPAM